MSNKHDFTRRAVLKGAPVAIAATMAPTLFAAAIEAQPNSRLTVKIAAFEAAKARYDAASDALSAAELAVDNMEVIRVPLGLLPNGSSPNGWVELSTFSESAVEERIRHEAESAKSRICTPYAEALAPGRNSDIAAGIDAMRDRSLAALQKAVEVRKQREADLDIPALSAEFWEADAAFDDAVCAILSMVPVTPGEALEKASWLRQYLHTTKGHMVVQEWDALIASIGGVRLPSIAEGL